MVRRMFLAEHTEPALDPAATTGLKVDIVPES